MQKQYQSTRASFIDTLLGLNPLSANPTKWSNTLKQFVGNLPKNCLSVFDNLLGFAFEELTIFAKTLNLRCLTGLRIGLCLRTIDGHFLFYLCKKSEAKIVKRMFQPFF